MEDRVLLNIFFEQKYLQLLNLYVCKDRVIDIPEAYLYAMRYRVYPIFHVENTFGVESIEELILSDPYAGLYDVDFFQVTKLAEDIDARYQGKNYQTFYEIVDSNRGISRDKIYNVLRYFRLSDRFDDDVYKKVTSNCPVEYQRIDKDIKDYELSVFI
jgi:hypothetical protein